MPGVRRGLSRCRRPVRPRPRRGRPPQACTGGLRLVAVSWFAADRTCSGVPGGADLASNGAHAVGVEGPINKPETQPQHPAATVSDQHRGIAVAVTRRWHRWSAPGDADRRDCEVDLKHHQLYDA